MIWIRRGLSLAGLLLLTSAVASGGDYTDPKGFAFTYPEDWVPLTQSAMGEVNQALPPELKDWIANNNVDLSLVAVVLVRNGHEEFLENLNVVVQKQQIPVDDKAVKRLAESLPKQFESMGVSVDNVQSRVQKIGSHDAVVFDYQSRMPGVAYLLRQRQVFFPGGGNTYIVTCSARAESFDQYLPTFEKILASFQVPAPVASGFAWSRVMSTGVVAGIVGGLVGGLTVARKKSPNMAKPEQHGDSAPGED